MQNRVHLRLGHRRDRDEVAALLTINGHQRRPPLGVQRQRDPDQQSFAGHPPQSMQHLGRFGADAAGGFIGKEAGHVRDCSLPPDNVAGAAERFPKLDQLLRGGIHRFRERELFAGQDD
jgi:hypothetical protein